jgi:hypothetical protein
MVYKGLAGWLKSGDYSIRGRKRVYLVKLQADLLIPIRMSQSRLLPGSHNPPKDRPDLVPVSNERARPLQLNGGSCEGGSSNKSVSSRQ